MSAQPKLYSFTVKTIEGRDRPLADYAGKVLLIVNVASKCGFTPQYKELQELFDLYKGRGFMILGFPANDFLWQEPGSNDEIRQFCTATYGVTFDMFAKISVKGKEMHPLYRYLTRESPVDGAVKWNFQKYLVDRKGNVVAKYSPGTEPMAKEILEKLEELLKQPA